MTIQTLTRRAQLVCDSPGSLADENKYLENEFNKENHNKDFSRRNTYKNTEPDVTNNDATPVITATIPYIKGTSETTARILQPYSVHVAHKPITTLPPLLMNVKDRRTEPKTGSILQDQMLRLPGHLYWLDRQKFKHTTD